MDRATIFRNVFFTAYALAVGVAYLTLTHGWLQGIFENVVLWVFVLLLFFNIGFVVANSDMPNLLRLLFILASPISVPVFLIVFAARLEIEAKRERRAFRALMESKKRFLDGDALRAKLEARAGTLIAETDHKGGAINIWWTEDDILARGTPIASDEEWFAVMQGNDHAFNSQCFKGYLDPDTGKAFLTSIPPRKTESGKWTRKYSGIPVVTVIKPLRAIKAQSTGC